MSKQKIQEGKNRQKESSVAPTLSKPISEIEAENPNKFLAIKVIKTNGNGKAIEGELIAATDERCALSEIIKGRPRPILITSTFDWKGKAVAFLCQMN